MCAPPRRFSQLTTSFIAYTRLGIHHVPFVACQKLSPLQLVQSLPRKLTLPNPPFRGRPARAAPAARLKCGALHFFLFDCQRASRPMASDEFLILTLVGLPIKGFLAFIEASSLKSVVEVRGLEPLTPCLQNRCSAN